MSMSPDQTVGVDLGRLVAIIAEELWSTGGTGIGWGLHTDIVLPYLMAYANAEQKKRWRPLPTATIGARVKSVSKR